MLGSTQKSDKTHKTKSNFKPVAADLLNLWIQITGFRKHTSNLYKKYGLIYCEMIVGTKLKMEH